MRNTIISLLFIPLMVFVAAHADTPPPPNNFIYSSPSAPATPPSGKYKLWLKASDQKAYVLDDTGTSTDYLTLFGISGTNTGDVTIGTANGLSLVGQALSLQLSSGSQPGALSSANWTTFNGKEGPITATTSADYYRGDKTFQTLNTAAVPESGSLYYTNARGIGSVLTGYTSGAGTVAATDSILQAIQKINGNVTALITGVSSVFGRTGAVTATSGDYNTSLVTENTNLYFTDARAIAAPLTGYTSGAGTVAATDTILQAIQKLNGNIAGGTGANTALSNLASPAVNISILPGADSTIDLGSGTKRWQYIYAAEAMDASDVSVVNFSGRVLRDGAGADVVEWASTTGGSASQGVLGIYKEVEFRTGQPNAYIRTVDGGTQQGLIIETGNIVGAPSGDAYVRTGTSDTTGTGNLYLTTGAPSAANINAGGIISSTGDATGSGASGIYQFLSGNVVDGTSGNILWSTGQASGVGGSGSTTIGTGTTIDGSAGQILLQGGNASGTGNGGALNFQAGQSATAAGGGVTIQGGNSLASGAAGSVSIFSGTAVDGASGDVSVISGATTGDGISGAANLKTGDAAGTGASGSVNINTGNQTDNAPAGDINITAGYGNDDRSGSVYLTVQPATGIGDAGKIGFVDGSEGTTGHVWTSIDNLGNGHWEAPGGGAGNLTGPITSVGLATSVASQTGTGSTFVMDTSPTLVTPALGTPTALVGTNITGTGAGFTAGTVTTNANLTGPITSVGNATSVASQTGTGSTFVMNTSPTLVTPALGTPTALVGTNITGTASGLTAGNVTTNANLTGPITSTGNATTVAAQTGTGSTFVMQASPTLTTPVLGAATGTSLNITGQYTSTQATGTAPLVISSTTRVSNLNVATAGTADVLTTARTINGTSFNGSANVTVTAAAGTLTGTTLNATVVTSSLTSVGTIATGTWNATAIGLTKGGSGQTTANASLNAFLPTQTGNGTKFLQTDGTNTSWQAAGGGSGTVTSVDMSVPSFLSVSGNPVTTSGTLAVTLSGTALPLANGGTGQTSFSSGLISSNGSALSSGVATIAQGGTNNGSLTVTAGGVMMADGSKVIASNVGTTAQYLAGGTTPAFTSFVAPTIQRFTKLFYTTFTITAGNTASVGSTWTNNGFTYTLVYPMLVGDTTIVLSGTGVAAASGTLTYASGTHTGGNITFSSKVDTGQYRLPSSPRAPLYLVVKYQSGGGGGGANGTGGADGSNGVASTFSATGISIGQGLGGKSDANGGVGGTVGGSTASTNLCRVFPGGYGSYGSTTAGAGSPGGVGGASGSGGPGGAANRGGASWTGWGGAAGTGAGGAGASGAGAFAAAGGGGGGAYAECAVNSPSSTYTFQVGGGGFNGVIGTGGSYGGLGADGFVEVWEYYQ